MILDHDLIVSNEQVVTASAASTNYIDLGEAGDAVTKELYLVVKSVDLATASGAATVTIALQTDDNSSFSSATTLFTTAAIPKASLTADTAQIKVRIPLGCEQYLRLYYTVATGPLTAGSFSGFFVMDTDHGNQL